ncbi:MAG: HAMP domain-containing histidine kinase [Alphaproteobacteria bacterium]|nr:HAMP domain-containing histidine kinase [Alphaproteobacteria bacterium]
MELRNLPFLPRRVGLSARLLLLTVFFVMLTEVAVFVPSIARYRLVYLEQKLAASHLAGLALDATPDRMVTAQLSTTLLRHVGAYAVSLYGDGKLTHNLMEAAMPTVDREIDLRDETFVDLIRGAFDALVQGRNRILRVIGPSPKDAGVLAVVVLDEWPMREEMIDYSERILLISVLIAVVTASLLYLSLQVLLVGPMRRLTQRMVSFHPEVPATDAPSSRTDELGVAETSLASMQDDLRHAFRQQARLAALGGGVSKLGHDLRNILSTVQVLSDRLADSADPEVKRLTPRLVRAVNRAVALTQVTLDFATDRPAVIPTRFPLADLVQEVGQDQGVVGEAGFRLNSTLAADFAIDADRDQLYRVLGNLVRNARLSGAKLGEIGATNGPGGVSITIKDDGPGIPEVVRPKLFQPFNTGRPGGTGLGLAIARDLVEAHGGRLRLVESGPEGTIFRIDLPLSGAIPAIR